MRLILIHPCGFDLNAKAVRRAGLDYWKYLSITEYASWKDFIQQENPLHLIAFTSHATTSLYSYEIPANAYFIFGPESTGLTPELLNSIPTHKKLPILNPKIRSLNLSNVVTACCYEAYRQLISQ
jgi:tRNA (cytidine/uridine-2'-O-)-methyltransferase